MVLERCATFQHYYLMEVYPPAPLTVTLFCPGLTVTKIPAGFYALPAEFWLYTVFGSGVTNPQNVESTQPVPLIYPASTPERY